MNSLLINCLAVGAAGFAGAITRYLVAVACNAAFGRGFPVGTTLINLSGSFALGYFAAWSTHRTTLSDPMRLAVATGFLGAYTTFSTWALESNALLESGHYWRAALNIAGSALLGILALRLGLAMRH